MNPRKGISSTFDFFKNIILFSSSRLFNAAVMLSIGIITARLLEPEGRGYYALFFTLTGLVSTFSHIGISQSNVYHLNQKKTPLTILLGNTLIFVSFVMAIIGLAFMFFYYFKPITLIGSEGIYIWFLLWIAIFCMLGEQCFSGLVFGNHLYDFQSKFLYIHSSLLLGATLLLFLTYNSVQFALELRVGATLIFFSTYFFRSLSVLNIKRTSKSVVVFYDQVKFGFRSWLQNTIGFLNYRGYFLVLAFYSNAETIGIFSISFLTIEVVRFIPDSISTLILPRLSQKDSRKHRAMIAAQSNRMILFATVIVSICMFLSVDLIIPFLFGDEYLESIVIAKILLLGSVFGTVYQVFTRYFTSEAKQVNSIISATVGIFIGIGSSLVLIPNYGALGASIAYTTGSLCCSFCMIYFFYNQTKISLIETLILRPEDIRLIKSLVLELKKKSMI